MYKRGSTDMNCGTHSMHEKWDKRCHCLAFPTSQGWSMSTSESHVCHFILTLVFKLLFITDFVFLPLKLSRSPLVLRWFSCASCSNEEQDEGLFSAVGGRRDKLDVKLSNKSKFIAPPSFWNAIGDCRAAKDDTPIMHCLDVPKRNQPISNQRFLVRYSFSIILTCEYIRSNSDCRKVSFQPEYLPDLKKSCPLSSYVNSRTKRHVKNDDDQSWSTFHEVTLHVQHLMDLSCPNLLLIGRCCLNEERCVLSFVNQFEEKIIVIDVLQCHFVHLKIM